MTEEQRAVLRASISSLQSLLAGDEAPKPAKTIDTAGEILDDGIRLAKPHPDGPVPFNG